MAPAAAAGAVAGAVAAAGTTAYAAAYAVTYLVVYAGGVMLLNAATRALTPKQPKNDEQTQGLGLNYQGTTEPRRLIYGEVRVGGMETIPPLLSGTNNQYLHRVLTLAGCEVTSIPHVYFDQNTITNAFISTSGDVGAGTYANKASIRRYIGTSAQAVDPVLNAAFPSIWSTTARGREVAYVGIRHEYDPNVYSSGVPDVRCIVLGRRVYDPRLDSTNGGSGSQRYTDPDTWTYSTNTALCIRDYLTHRDGGNYDDSEIDDSLVIAAANVCDEDVLIPPASPATTQKRYTFNGVVFCNQELSETLNPMLAAMNGRCILRDGKWRMYAGKWDTPLTTINDKDWLEVTRATSSLGREDRWNAVRGWFVDPTRNYTRQECSPARNTVYETQDGNERIWIETENPYCNNHYEMQRSALLVNRRGRNQAIITGKLPIRFWHLIPWETVTVNYAPAQWISKTFRVVRAQVNVQVGYVDVALAEETSSDWDDPNVIDYVAPSAISIPIPSNTIPSIPENFIIQGIGKGISFNFTPGAIVVPGQKYQLFEGNSNTLPNAALTADDMKPGGTIPKTDLTTRYYWLRAINVNSEFAGYTPASFGAPGAAASLTADLTIVSIAGASKVSSTVNMTTGQGQCIPSGGTTTVNSPYAFTWEQSSGDTHSIAGVNSQYPTWTASGHAEGEARVGYWRCFLRDSVPTTVVGGPVEVRTRRLQPPL